jgi:nicotinate-nucleotide adenylyltransferase
MKLGILGGTFDPPHNGHLRIARAAQDALGLAQIVFIPAKLPPHKLVVEDGGLEDPVSPPETRFAMLKLALRDHPDFVISMLEAERDGPSYTVDTLRELCRETPGADVFFIMGMDSLVNLPTWHQPQEIVKLCKLAVLKRPGYQVDLDRLEFQVPGVTSAVVMVPAPEIDLSSTEIRARVRRGEPIRELVPTAVADYIEQHQLYKR